MAHHGDSDGAREKGVGSVTVEKQVACEVNTRLNCLPVICVSVFSSPVPFRIHSYSIFSPSQSAHGLTNQHAPLSPLLFKL